MSENMALLSQNEIDALVKFLLEKQNVQGSVLDQASIDRLVDVLQDKHLIRKMNIINEDSDLSTVTKPVNQLLLLEGETDPFVQANNYCLLFEQDENGMVQVVCQHVINRKRYAITPECMEQSRFVEEESSWGRTISPIMFDTLAGMLRVQYTKETFFKVCECFAEVVYGDKNSEIPKIYMPNANKLVKHMM